MPKCNAPGCTTDENARINGRSLTLFSFPTYDDSLVSQWEKNSKVFHSPDKNPVDSKLCELHFESNCFASEEKNALAPGAVPTIFELNNKRSMAVEEAKDPDDQPEPPAKQTKLHAAVELPTATTSQETSETQFEPKAIINKKAENRKAEDSSLSIVETVRTSLNRKDGSSVFTKQIDMGKKVYRLIIRIDKVIETKDLPKETKVVTRDPEVVKLQKLPSIDAPKNGSTVRPCSKTGCKLVKTVLNSKPVFQCERCQKYYIVKENKSPVTSWTCYICKEMLPNPESLSLHVREHLVCDMCQAQCSTQISYDKHLMLHVSTDPLLPYKCHECPSNFEVKADVRQHYVEKHSKNGGQDQTSRKKTSSGQALFRCEYCYAVFKKEQTYKSHIESHMGDVGNFDCALRNKRFKTAKHLATHQVCSTRNAVCSKQFPRLEDVETHMKTHVDSGREGHKCNICEKIFKNESVLSSHMRGHLSRAHRCPSCNKAFVNKTTLGIHFKTHSHDDSISPSRDLTGKKRHTCTLCPSTFDSRSRLYNHIMTHLEQMHGGEEGSNAVFDGLDELLESEEDLIS